MNARTRYMEELGKEYGRVGDASRYRHHPLSARLFEDVPCLHQRRDHGRPVFGAPLAPPPHSRSTRVIQNPDQTLAVQPGATNWWEGQAIAVRSQTATKEGLSQMQPRFPFRIPELHPDNDSALVNDLLWDWTQQERIRLSRSWP